MDEKIRALQQKMHAYHNMPRCAFRIKALRVMAQQLQALLAQKHGH